MNTILSFKTIFPEESEYGHPRGYSICEYIKNELSKAGFHVSRLENYRDIAWSVDCLIDSKTLYFFVGYLGTKKCDWQLIICSSAGIISRILGHKYDDECLQLAKTIHKILSNDNRFSDLKWFSRYTGTPKDVWCKQPEEVC